MGETSRWAESSPKSPVACYLAVATWMITKPLMSGNCELTRSTCSCLGPLLEGVMLNWIKAFSRGCRLGTLETRAEEKAVSPFSLSLACQAVSPRASGLTHPPLPALTFLPSNHVSTPFIGPECTSYFPPWLLAPSTLLPFPFPIHQGLRTRSIFFRKPSLASETSA